MPPGRAVRRTRVPGRARKARSHARNLRGVAGGSPSRHRVKTDRAVRDRPTRRTSLPILDREPRISDVDHGVVAGCLRGCGPEGSTASPTSGHARSSVRHRVPPRSRTRCCRTGGGSTELASRRSTTARTQLSGNAPNGRADRRRAAASPCRSVPDDRHEPASRGSIARSLRAGGHRRAPARPCLARRPRRDHTECGRCSCKGCHRRPCRSAGASSRAVDDETRDAAMVLVQSDGHVE